MSKALDAPKLSKKLSLKGCGTNKDQERFSREKQLQNILDWLYFSWKQAHYGKSLIAIFQDFFASTIKIFLLSGGLNTTLSFSEV